MTTYGSHMNVRDAVETIGGSIAGNIGKLFDLNPSVHSRNLVDVLTQLSTSQGMRRLWEAEIASSLLADRSVHSPVPVVDLFAGCGGLSLGFEAAGFDVLVGLDNWKPAVETYSLNLSHEGIVADLENVDATVEILERYRLPSGVFPGIIGGPPCQDFSSAGARKEGSRADLTRKFAEIVGILQPEFFVMENVAIAAKAVAYKEALSTLCSFGYEVETVVLNANHFGVPQRRSRLFAIGTREPGGTAAVLQDLACNESHVGPTVRDWFGIDSGVPDFYYRHPRSYSRRGVFSANEPSPTIRGVNRPIPSTYKSHEGDKATATSFPELAPLTFMQRAQIQTFPSGYRFVGPNSTVEQMIGNAVPVRLAHAVALALMNGLQLWD